MRGKGADGGIVQSSMVSLALMKSTLDIDINKHFAKVADYLEGLAIYSLYL